MKRDPRKNGKYKFAAPNLQEIKLYEMYLFMFTNSPYYELHFQ